MLFNLCLGFLLLAAVSGAESQAVPPIPPMSKTLPASFNFSTPYSIWYNDAGNYPPSVFNPGDAAQYGFIVDDTSWPRHNGTASFSIEDDPAWPNFLFGLSNDTYDPGMELAT
jgi:hypothetical protein